MTAKQYVELREGRGAVVRRVQDGWMVTCPAHEDRTPSLHVSEGDDGRVLLHCHAGCETGDVLAADGLDFPDLFPDGGEGGNARSEVAAYSYTDEHGELLFQCVRYVPKDFKQRQPNGRGGWAWNLKGVRRVLYRLPEVVAAVQDGQTIYVAEGEKDVHALVRAGVAATCSPMGAGKWRHEYAEVLRGASVVVVADQDAEGHKHAQQVAISLRGVAASVEIVASTEGKDAAAHLGAGKTVHEFVPLDDLVPVSTALPHGDLTLPVIDALRRYQAIEDTDAIRVTAGGRGHQRAGRRAAVAAAGRRAVERQERGNRDAARHQRRAHRRGHGRRIARLERIGQQGQADRPARADRRRQASW